MKKYKFTEKHDSHLNNRKQKGVGSTDTLQKLLRIYISYPIHVLCRTAIQDGFPFDRTIPVLGRGALLRVEQMAGLLRDDLSAVLDLKDLAGRSGWVKDHHIELTNSELQNEHLLFCSAVSSSTITNRYLIFFG